MKTIQQAKQVSGYNAISARPASLQDLLATISIKDFLASYWGQSILYLSGRGTDFYSSLFCLEDVDALLAQVAQEGEEISFVKGYNPPYYNYQRLHLPFVNKAYGAYADGYSIVFNDLAKQHVGIASLTKALEGVFHYPVRTNAYLTPAGSCGFEAHYDGHDVLVLQVHGCKRWVVYADFKERLPRKGSPVWKDELKDKPPLLDVELRAGDLLYLPRGFVHQADTLDSGVSSLHLTLGIQAVTWADLLVHAVQAVSRRNPHMRAGLPAGFLEEGESRDSAVEGFHKALDVFAGEADFGEAVKLFARELISQRPPVPDGHFSHLDQIGLINAATWLYRRKGLMCRTFSDGEGMTIEFSGSNLHGGPRLREAISYIEHNTCFRVSNLPGLAEAEQVTLAQTLVREGFLRIKDIDVTQVSTEKDN